MRFFTLVASIAAHAALLAVLVVVTSVAVDAVPAIRMVWTHVPAKAAELPEPPPPPRARRPDAPARIGERRAPTTAPDQIAPEQIAVEPGPAYDGPPGPPGGDPSAVGLLLSDGPAPVPPPPPVKPLRSGGDIRPPTKIKHVAPVYPALAIENKVQGIVILDAVIDEKGAVRDVRVLRSLPLLDRAAIEAVKQWQFTPTRLNGQAVPVVMTVTVSFELK